MYHVIYISCAVRGRRGFKLFYLPYFEKWLFMTLHFFVSSLQMNCVLSLVTKIYCHIYIFVSFRVIVMTTTNLTTQCFEYVSTTWTDVVLHVHKKEGDWSRLCFLCVNNDCEITIKLLYILIVFELSSFPNKLFSVYLTTNHWLKSKRQSLLHECSKSCFQWVVHWFLHYY